MDYEPFAQEFSENNIDEVTIGEPYWHHHIFIVPHVSGKGRFTLVFLADANQVVGIVDIQFRENPSRLQLF